MIILNETNTCFYPVNKTGFGVGVDHYELKHFPSLLVAKSDECHARFNHFKAYQQCKERMTSMLEALENAEPYQTC